MPAACDVIKQGQRGRAVELGDLAGLDRQPWRQPQRGERGFDLGQRAEAPGAAEHEYIAVLRTPQLRSRGDGRMRRVGGHP